MPDSVPIDQLLCLPEPLMPAKGFSCRITLNPCLSATVFLHKPALCIGNILGSDLFNIAMLSTLAVLFIRSFRNVPIARGNVIVSLYLIVIYGVLMLDYFGVLDFDILTVNIITFIFIVVYALAVRHLSGETEAPDEDCQEEVGLSLNQIIVRFIIASIAIIGLSIVLTYITDDIAQHYNLGVGLAGALFLGVATSLPEVASTIALFRMKNYDIAVGNIVGSNLFNFMVLCIADVLSLRSDIYDFTDVKVQNLLVFGLVATIVTLPALKTQKTAIRNRLRNIRDCSASSHLVSCT